MHGTNMMQHTFQGQTPTRLAMSCLGKNAIPRPERFEWRCLVPAQTVDKEVSNHLDRCSHSGIILIVINANPPFHLAQLLIRGAPANKRYRAAKVYLDRRVQGY